MESLSNTYITYDLLRHYSGFALDLLRLLTLNMLLVQTMISYVHQYHRILELNIIHHVTYEVHQYFFFSKSP